MPDSMASRPIQFVHRGQVVQVQGAAITRTTLDWLREDAHCTATKEGCNEGDCGACTVVVAELADAEGSTANDGLTLRPVNACLRWLPTLDGKALLTVEDLNALASAHGQALHPVQQAMVQHHGSQCGFCTPGFVMSLFAAYESGCARRSAAGQCPATGAGTDPVLEPAPAASAAAPAVAPALPSRAELADALAGNLCRCTGYRPILDAAQAMFTLPELRLQSSALARQLRELQAGAAARTSLHYRAANAAFGGREDSFFAPRSVAELSALRAAMPQARLLAGATDIGLWTNKQFRDVGDVLYIGEVAELRRIEQLPGDAAHPQGQLRIGAAATLEDAWAALAAHWPALHEMWRRFAGPPTRHAGTMGGNVANGSPIGDSAPVLIALGAQIVLQRESTVRRLALEDFYLGYMRNALADGEFVAALELPLPTAAQQVRAYKNSKRFDCDISALSAGFALRLEAGRVADVRLAFGGMAATVKRAAGAEAALSGKPYDEATLEAALKALDGDFSPLSDLRASAAYRQQAARALLRRFWLETRADAPLPATMLNVDAFAVQFSASGVALAGATQ
jgi:xanthine dehydrogenase small subunit